MLKKLFQKNKSKYRQFKKLKNNNQKKMILNNKNNL